MPTSSRVCSRLAFSSARLVGFAMVIVLFAMAANTFAAGTVIWSSASGNLPLSNGGGVTEVATAGQDHPMVFAIVDGKGLWQSTDLGKSWTHPTGTDAPITSPQGITGALDNNQIAYCGVSTAGGGLWRTEDGGKTWKIVGQPTDPTATCDVQHITLSDKAPDLVLVGLRSGSKMLVSSDHGKTFTAVDLGASVDFQFPMIIDATHWAVGSLAKPNIRCTEDGGKTWTAGDGATDYFPGPLSFAQVNETILASKHHGNCISADGGKTWKFVMGTHTRVIGSVGELIFQEADRETIRGTHNRILTLQLKDNLGQTWHDATGSIRALVPDELRSSIIVPNEVDPYGHVRIGTAWAATYDQKNVFLSLGKAGLYRGELFAAKGGPRVLEVTCTPGSATAGEETQVVVNAIITAKQAKVTKAYARLDVFGLPDLPLYDDGQHHDGEANDKTFGNVFTIPATIKASDLTIPVVAEDDHNRSGSGETKFSLGSTEDRLIVWNGEEFAHGAGWTAPKSALNVIEPQNDEAHSGKSALELRGSGSGYIGGGWNWHGWYPPNAGTDVSNCRNLSFWIKVAMNEGTLGTLDVGLVCSAGGKATATVPVGDYLQVNVSDGNWHEIVIPLKDMLNKVDGFDLHSVWMLNISTWAPAKRDFSIYLDDIGFDNRKIRARNDMVSAPEPRNPAALPADAPRVQASVDIKAAGLPISPYIYGAAMGDRKVAKEMGMTTLREGGNEISAFNWKTGFSSKGSDWFFENDGKESPREQTWMAQAHGDNAKAGFETYFSLPSMGRVAKDGTSSAFDTNKYPNQDTWAGQSQPTDRIPTAGSGHALVKNANGEVSKDASGKPITTDIVPNPDDTSVAMTPEEQTEFLSFMINKMGYGTADKGGIKFVAIDNEPTLWNSTHRGMHPAALGYDDLWNLTLTYATLIKKIDPSVQVAGPVTWGWSDLYYSALDSQLVGQGKGSWDAPPDFTAHGKVPQMKWWLTQLHNQEAKVGKRLVDILDVHFYPQNGIYQGAPVNDPKTMEARVQETRVLWDPTWKDPSWMGKETNGIVRFIPMLKEWIQECNPGMKLSLGEYGFGGESDVSGGVTQAELLGIFAREGVSNAYYWFFPPMNSSSYFGYKMYRNPDGSGTAFGDNYLPSTVSAPEDISLHAARDSKTGRVTCVLVNKRMSKAAKVDVNFGSDLPAQDLTVYEYSDADRYCIGRWPARSVSGKTISLDVPAMSVLRFDVKP